jgi:hypothetical protein
VGATNPNGLAKFALWCESSALQREAACGSFRKCARREKSGREVCQLATNVSRQSYKPAPFLPMEYIRITPILPNSPAPAAPRYFGAQVVAVDVSSGALVADRPEGRSSKTPGPVQFDVNDLIDHLSNGKSSWHSKDVETRFMSDSGRSPSNARRNHPTTTKDQPWAERSQEDRPPLLGRLRGGMMQGGVQRGTAHGRTEVPPSAADRRKILDGYAQLLGKKSNKARIRLMRGEGAHVVAGNSATVFHLVDHLLHAADRGSGKRIPIELHVQQASAGATDGDRFRVLRGAAKEKLSQPIG